MEDEFGKVTLRLPSYGRSGRWSDDEAAVRGRNGFAGRAQLKKYDQSWRKDHRTPYSLSGTTRAVRFLLRLPSLVWLFQRGQRFMRESTARHRGAAGCHRHLSCDLCQAVYGAEPQGFSGTRGGLHRRSGDTPDSGWPVKAGVACGQDRVIDLAALGAGRRKLNENVGSHLWKDVETEISPGSQQRTRLAVPSSKRWNYASKCSS